MGSPDWVQFLTYIGEDFDDGTISETWWYSDFLSGTQISAGGDGDGIVCTSNSSPTGEQQNLLPVGAEISGDFVLEAAIKCGDVYDSGAGIVPAISLYYGAELCRFHWDDGSAVFCITRYSPTVVSQEISGQSFSAGKEIKCRFVRAGSIVSMYYDTGTGWVLSSVSASHDGPVSQIVIRTWQMTPGFSYFRFQSDAGLPIQFQPRYYSPMRKMLPGAA